MAEIGEWRTLGEFSVDSAAVWIGDACQSYPGVEFMPGLGDGHYTVSARIVDCGPEWGERIAEIRVSFVDPDDTDWPPSAASLPLAPETQRQLLVAAGPLTCGYAGGRGRI